MRETHSLPASVAWVLLLLACGSNSDGKIVGTVAASSALRFSAWSDPVRLGAPINTPSNDQQPTLSKDGLTLYFASNRPGSVPNPTSAPLLDIWVAHRADAEAGLQIVDTVEIDQVFQRLLQGRGVVIALRLRAARRP